MANIFDLTGTNISVTYPRILQTDSGNFYDGLGNTVSIGAGSVGPQGPRGDIGLYGPQGIAGVTGSQGPRGDIGLYGPQGSTGATGSGTQGPQGIAGATGSGAQGPQGFDGATGATGSINFIASATAPLSPTSGDRWYDLTTGLEYVYINDGDSLQWVAPASIGPQGPTGTGTVGVTGSTGPVGATGASGSTLPSVQTVTSAAIVTPTASDNIVVINAQAAGLTLANPTGVWVDGQSLIIRIKDNGVAKAIGYGTNYRAVGVTRPTITTAGKVTYLGILYNSNDTQWDIIGVTTEF